MLPIERRASASLASIFALRMLGLFLVLPVFVLEARKYPGGDDAAVDAVLTHDRILPGDAGDALIALLGVQIVQR